MTKKNILVSLGLLLIALVLFFITKNYQQKNTTLTHDPSEQNLNPRDPGAYKTLFQMAQQQDPEARIKALEKAKSEDPFVRELGATLLGFYSDKESTEALQVLLQDSFEKVKIKAIYALANLKDEGRTQTLIALLNDNKFNEREKVHLFTALLRISQDSEAIDKCIDNLIYLMEHSKDEKSKVLASSTLSQFSKPNEKIRLSFEKNINNSHPTVVANIIRHLASSKNPSYKKNSKALYENTQLDPLIQVALIETLHLVCIPSRLSIFKDFLNRKYPEVRIAAIQQLVYHKSKETLKLLEDISKNSEDTKSAQLAQQVLTQLKPEERIDRCQ